MGGSGKRVLAEKTGCKSPQVGKRKVTFDRKKRMPFPGHCPEGTNSFSPCLHHEHRTREVSGLGRQEEITPKEGCYDPKAGYTGELLFFISFHVCMVKRKTLSDFHHFYYL